MRDHVLSLGVGQILSIAEALEEMRQPIGGEFAEALVSGAQLGAGVAFTPKESKAPGVRSSIAKIIDQHIGRILSGFGGSILTFDDQLHAKFTNENTKPLGKISEFNNEYNYFDNSFAQWWDESYSANSKSPTPGWNYSYTFNPTSTAWIVTKNIAAASDTVLFLNGIEQRYDKATNTEIQKLHTSAIEHLALFQTLARLGFGSDVTSLAQVATTAEPSPSDDLPAGSESGTERFSAGESDDAESQDNVGREPTAAEIALADQWAVRSELSPSVFRAVVRAVVRAEPDTNDRTLALLLEDATDLIVARDVDPGRIVDFYQSGLPFGFINTLLFDNPSDEDLEQRQQNARRIHDLTQTRGMSAYDVDAILDMLESQAIEGSDEEYPVDLTSVRDALESDYDNETIVKALGFIYEGRMRSVDDYARYQTFDSLAQPDLGLRSRIWEMWADEAIAFDPVGGLPAARALRDPQVLAMMQDAENRLGIRFDHNLYSIVQGYDVWIQQDDRLVPTGYLLPLGPTDGSLQDIINANTNLGARMALSPNLEIWRERLQAGLEQLEVDLDRIGILTTDIVLDRNPRSSLAIVAKAYPDLKARLDRLQTVGGVRFEYFVDENGLSSAMAGFVRGRTEAVGIFYLYTEANLIDFSGEAMRPETVDTMARALLDAVEAGDPAARQAVHDTVANSIRQLEAALGLSPLIQILQMERERSATAPVTTMHPLLSVACHRRYS